MRRTWLDRAIAWVSPARGFDRARRRAALAVLERTYEGASVGRRTEGWRIASTGANAEVAPALSRLRDRSRDLVRNNAYAAKATQALVSNIVGTGIVPRARAKSKRLAEAADRLWARFVAEADVEGLTDLYGLQALIVRTIVESGECLVRIRERYASDGLAVPVQVEVLEPDFLDTAKAGEMASGGFILSGVEFDQIGRRVAYWLFPTHPGESSFRRGALASQRVPARSVLHLFERQRPGQVRGVPWVSSTVLKLRDLDEYDDAELVAKKIAACFAAFVTGDLDGEPIGKDVSESADGHRVESFEPGMVAYLAAGRDVKFATPQTAPGYADYMRVQLHAVAAGMGLTYELLTGDLSQVNYSSIRAGLLEFRRRIEALQWQMLVPGLCRPLWRRFVETAQAAGSLAAGEVEAEWTAPRFEAVDPLKDVQADLFAVRAGFMSLKEAIARAGYDPAGVLAEIAETNALLDQLGLVLDSDPRRATRTGQAKDASVTGEDAPSPAN
ncbi:MAG TPA: phage portal protein [Bauldia sp.]|nr:phage portal protein [Bauldia sp.]